MLILARFSIKIPFTKSVVFYLLSGPHKPVKQCNFSSLKWCVFIFTASKLESRLTCPLAEQRHARLTWKRTPAHVQHKRCWWWCCNQLRWRQPEGGSTGLHLPNWASSLLLNMTHSAKSDLSPLCAPATLIPTLRMPWLFRIRADWPLSPWPTSARSRFMVSNGFKATVLISKSVLTELLIFNNSFIFFSCLSVCACLGACVTLKAGSFLWRHTGIAQV